MKKPYGQVTAMSRGDNEGLEDMAGKSLSWDQGEQSQMDTRKVSSQD